MTEVDETICYDNISILPTEILLDIFTSLQSKDLMRCRQVCTRWKSIVDDLACDHNIWANFCEKELEDYYWIAKRKANYELNWFSLFKSLSLWSKLAEADEEIIDFAYANKISEEIRSVEILEGGILAIHKKCVVQYFNANSLEIASRESVIGDYSRYIENEHAIVFQNYQFHMFLIRKISYNSNQQEFTTFDNVKMVYLFKDEVYFVTVSNDIFHCLIYEGQRITARLIHQAPDQDGIMSLGMSDGCLNILTYQRNIYSLVDGDNLVLKHPITHGTNIMDELHKYNLLEYLDWRVYFQWMFILLHTIPNNSLRDIIIIRTYGDIFFVGTCYGVLKIFNRPFINGELDIFNSQPMREINLMERLEEPVQSTCPILDIEVMETENGHTVFVAMTKEVAVIKFTHNLPSPSWPELPVQDSEWQLQELLS